MARTQRPKRGVIIAGNPSPVSPYHDGMQEAQVREIVARMLGSQRSAFPIGAVYVSVTGVNPATELGYGTWTAFGAGRALVGFSGVAPYNVVEAGIGAATVASAGSVAAPTLSGSTAAEAAHTHTYTQVPNHTHPITAVDGAHSHTVPIFTGIGLPGDRGVQGVDETDTTIDSGENAGAAATATENPTGGVATGTTAAGSSHSHGVGTLAASAPAFTGSATSVVQPSIVCYFWKRTA